MNMSKKTILISIAALVVTGALLTVAVSIFNQPDPVTPQTAKTVPQIADFLDQETRNTLEENLVSYTDSNIEEFVVSDGSYKETDEGIEFQVYNTVDQSLYNIQTVPSPEGDYSYVYVYCAPVDQQLPGVTCKLNLDHNHE